MAVDARKMRGLEIANTIGNRSAKAVSIRRLNKLAYKVRSQTNQDQWYNVINTYDDGWICECLDFQSRHLTCKHIHAVQFSKLLRKKIYQDTILQPLQDLQNQEVNPVAVESGQIVCPKCFSPTYQKFGIRHNKYGDMQRYVCKACNHRFVVNPAFENAKASAKIITAAIDLYFKGVSFRKISDHLKQMYGFSIHCSNVCRWVTKFTNTVQPYVDTLVPAQVGGVYHVDDMLLHMRKENNNPLEKKENNSRFKFNSHYSWLWNLMDSKTRFWICSKLSQKRDIAAGIALLKDMKKRAPLPKAFIHDGLPTYDEAYRKELRTTKNPRVQNIRSVSLRHEGLNARIERLNGTVRDREIVMHGMDKRKTAQDLVDAMRIHYNFIRPHMALENKTPAEEAGISLPLGENKVESLMRLAATNKNDIAQLLGFRINKVKVTKHDDCTEIKPNGWLDRREWREINEILTKNEFEWKSCSIDSCWIKKKC
jgi:transposase-like protein